MPERPPRRGLGGGAPGAIPKNSPTSTAQTTEPAVIALRMEDLALWTVERVARMPRDHKFIIGDRLVDTVLEVTTLLVQASFTRDKLGLLTRASLALTQAQILSRMAQRLNLLSIDQRQHFAVQSSEIGRMLGGWTRAVQSR